MADSQVKKITELSEKARRDFFKKVEKIAKKSGTNQKLMQDIADQAAQEYNKVFGRVGVHPLMHLKGGKKAPRYVVERDEMWVLYKPALWQMGGKEERWQNNVEKVVREKNSLKDCQKKYLESDQQENLQEWHGLLQARSWLDLDQPVAQWGFIQRLDGETDGPVVVAKTWRAQRALQVQMKEHIFSKGYICLVHGRVENKVQHVKTRFAELGQSAESAVMLKHDSENDPFYDWSQTGMWTGRVVRMAESFVKPMAYYHKKEDNSEYSLVYVNILTGITHQVRITMQCLGHPLVSDDRYLPKDVATADLKWCPRNFLTEVRSDFFDMFGPYTDEKRRRYHRVSIENPLPKMFQNILDNKLTLTEKLDPTADLYVGCQYWSIGDEQLMNAHPKDEEYRRKVMRWGQRHGIHLDALDRLLLLEKADIDDILNRYHHPSDKADEIWVCPKCMGYNSQSGVMECVGGPPPHNDCPGKRLVDDQEDNQLPKGWRDWASDPTIHLLLQVNPKWLEARRRILRHSRPAWEKPPAETEGSTPTEDLLVPLEAALVLNAKSGGCGILEDELLNIPGLEKVTLPLGNPPEDSNVHRSRLPGSGSYSRWLYTLKASERIKYSQDVDKKTKRYSAPVVVKADPLPEKMLITEEDRAKRKRAMEAKEEKLEDEMLKDVQSIKDPTALQALDASMEPAAKKSKTSTWKKMQSKSNPGAFYYYDKETGETSMDKPVEDTKWQKRESKSAPGEFYYYNSETGESRADEPDEMKSKEEPEVQKVEERWKRTESSSKPGNFFYFNPKTGMNEIDPPRVDLPWQLKESSSKKGQFYYFNAETGETTVDPPKGARPAGSTKRTVAVKKVASSKIWLRKMSETHKKPYWVNTKTGETVWTMPADADAEPTGGGEWKRHESKSNPGVFYYMHSKTGETSWDSK